MLLFIDNIFRFTQAGSEVSALLGRIPRAVGYQPTLATEMGELQERITSTNKGSITSVQAIYVPADDLTDPAPATAFAHLDATTVLSRAHLRAGHLPGRRSARLDVDDARRPTSSARSTTQVARAGAADAAEVQGAAGHHRHPRHGRAVGGRQADASSRARKIQRFLSQPFFVAEPFTGAPGKYVELKDTVAASRRSSTASATTCPSRRSTCRAASTTCAPSAEQHARRKRRRPAATMRLSHHHAARRARRHRRRGGDRARRARRVRRPAGPRAADVGAEAGRARLPGQGPRRAWWPSGQGFLQVAPARRAGGARRGHDRVLVLVDQAH